MEICQLIKDPSTVPIFVIVDIKSQEAKIERLIKEATASAGDDFSRIFAIAYLWWAIVNLNASLYLSGKEQRFWPAAERIFDRLRQNSDDLEFFNEIVAGDPLFS